MTSCIALLLTLHFWPRERNIPQSGTQTFLLLTAKNSNNKTPSTLQTQACESEKAIKEEFEKLHLFLWEEEKTRLKALKQEEEVKSQVMCEKLENIKDQIKTLSATISDIETALTANDLPFLQVCLRPLSTQVSLFLSTPYTYM